MINNKNKNNSKTFNLLTAFMENCGVDKAIVPCMRILKKGDDRMIKYKPEDAEISAYNMKSFINDYKAYILYNMV